ncbi:MAG: WXG100 family type VII secretion target [Pseudonocardiaceae bacterium]
MSAPVIVPASENPLVAARVDSTTAITGVGLVESAVGLYNGVESGSWVEGGLGAAGAGLETLGLVLDPVGTLASYGVAWLMEHVQPLSDALDRLAGDPDTIASYAATWRNVATAVQQAGADFGTAVNQGTAGWQGQAADAYRVHTAGQIEQLTAAGTGAQTVGSIVEGAGVLVGVVREVVRDLVAECVSTLIARIPQWAAEIGLTVGIATPHVVASAVALIARWVNRIADVIIKLVRSLDNLMPLIRQLDELFAGVRDGLSGTGRAAPPSPGLAAPSGPVTSPNSPDLSTDAAPSGGSTATEGPAAGGGPGPPDGTSPGGPTSGGPRDPNGPDGPGGSPDGSSPDGSRPELDREAMQDRDTFEDEYQRILDERGLDRAEHDRLRSTPSDLLTEAEARQVIEVRDAIRADPGTVMTKVLHPDQAVAYLDNLTAANGRDFDPGAAGGFVARGTDVADVKTPQDLRDALALDDRGAGWTPVPEGTKSALQLRFRAAPDSDMPIAYGGRTDAVADRMAELGGVDGPPIRRDDPYVGTGYTGGGVPEWQARGVPLGDRAEIWEINSSGDEALVGVYDPAQGWRRL